VREVHGIGVGLRHEFAAALAATTRAVDFIEIVPESWLRPQQRGLLDPCVERWPVAPHSTHLSIGGPDPIDPAFVAAIRAVVRRVDAPFYSDHVCYSSVGGLATGELLPLPFSAEAIEHVVARIAATKPALDVPLVLENPTYYAVMPGSTLDEATFLNAILAEGDCGMLLDVNNVYVNARNHGYDPYAFIDRMPMPRVRQLHLAGHRHDRATDTLVDNHGSAVIDEVWALYRYTLARAGRLVPTIIEWDNDVPALDVVLDEVDRARAEAAVALATGTPASPAR
jgi:uncharacterized protein (UPF0276 family)